MTIAFDWEVKHQAKQTHMLKIAMDVFFSLAKFNLLAIHICFWCEKEMSL